MKRTRSNPERRGCDRRKRVAKNRQRFASRQPVRVVAGEEFFETRKPVRNSLNDPQPRRPRPHHPPKWPPPRRGRLVAQVGKKRSKPNTENGSVQPSIGLFLSRIINFHEVQGTSSVAALRRRLSYLFAARYKMTRTFSRVIKPPSTISSRRGRITLEKV